VKHVGKTFENGELTLDGNEYQDCKFENVKLIFGAMGPLGMSNCEFVSCTWSLTGPAAHTISFLSGVYNGVGGTGQATVERTFDRIRSGSALGPSPKKAPIEFKPTIFIGHGRSADYLILSDFLRSRGYAVETFESSSRAGMTAKEVVESMAQRASMAFLVHTSEDELNEGGWRARQNVVHETGLFQGKLGFRRAVVIREEGCEAFSNLDGVQEIRYASGRMRDRLLEVLDTLDREFPSNGS
jgi:predicted nucleotide-binding protein